MIRSHVCELTGGFMPIHDSCLYRFSATTMIRLVYGYRISSTDDKYFGLAKSLDHLHGAVCPSLLDLSTWCEFYLGMLVGLISDPCKS